MNHSNRTRALLKGSISPERSAMRLNDIDMVVMDWGIGGLSVYNEIRREMPHLSIIYFSDSGTTPYGKLSATQLRARLLKIIRHFRSVGIEHFVVACNAASTALPSLEYEFKNEKVNVTGVIEHAIRLVRETAFKNVGGIGGRRTVLSRVYQSSLRTQRRALQMRVAQPLSAWIEQGKTTGRKLNLELQKILQPLKSCDAVLLACTHYPAIAAEIQHHVPHAVLLDPAPATAGFIKNNWTLSLERSAARTQAQKQSQIQSLKRSPSRSSSGKTVFLTTGDPARMKLSARLAFGNRIGKVNVADF